MNKIIDYWAMRDKPIRQSQIEAFEFIEEAIKQGKEYFLLSAPTGSGKSAIGVTFSRWAADQPPFNLFETGKGDIVETIPGSYYITPQNLLQDQLINEAESGVFFGKFGNIRSSIHYSCKQFSGNCAVGKQVGCFYKDEGDCTYDCQKREFINATISITNTAYLLNEHFHAHKLPPKTALIIDEAHRLESELSSANEINIFVQADNVKTELVQFEGNSIAWALWMKRYYMPYMNKKKKEYEKRLTKDGAISSDFEVAMKLVAIKRKILQLYRIIDEVQSNNGHFIQYEERFSEKSVTYIVKPIKVDMYAVPFFEKKAKYKLFMSASIESPKIFSQYTGIDESKIAFCNIKSSFPVENRPIYYIPVGSMAYKNKQETLPKLLDKTIEILNDFPNEKGIIHSHSYSLGEALVEKIENSKHRDRILYHPNGDYREKLYNEHIKSNKPTILVSPSVFEGFDFKDDLARFQIIPKIPYSAITDPYIKAKMKEPLWYAWEAIKALIQGTGRVVRHESDFGMTFILDEDLKDLIKRAKFLFPEWWLEALPKSK